MLSEYWLSEKLRRKCKEFANNIVFLQPKRLKNYLDMKKYFLAITLLATVWSTSASDTFWLGADISGTSGLEAFGAQLYNAQGEPRENTVLMREYGLNAARFRVWVNPKGGFSSKEDVLKLALRAKEQGMAIMIDFHYSDWWADPGKQNIPKAWEQMSYEEMCQALHSILVKRLTC
jgi:arabinogalactan endo-1,4-beta-galactosidase